MNAHSHIEIGPIDGLFGTSYFYKIDGVLSEPYANRASAERAAWQPQRVNSRGRLEPDPT